MVIYEIRKNDELYGEFEDLNELIEHYNDLIELYGSDSVKIDSYEVLSEFQKEERTITLTNREISSLRFYLRRNTEERKISKDNWFQFSKGDDEKIIYEKMLSNSLFVERETRDIESILSKLDCYIRFKR